MPEQDRPALGATSDDLGLCFTVLDGKPLRPGNFRRDVFHPLIDEAKVPMIRFHDMRHSGIGISLDTYSHVMPNLQTEAADVLERRLFGKA